MTRPFPRTSANALSRRGEQQRLCPKAKVLADGFECRGKRAHKAEKDVAAWLDRIAPGIASRQAGRTEENP